MHSVVILWAPRGQFTTNHVKIDGEVVGWSSLTRSGKYRHMCCCTLHCQSTSQYQRPPAGCLGGPAAKAQPKGGGMSSTMPVEGSIYKKWPCKAATTLRWLIA